MYTDEANEIYKKMCKKFHRDEGNITHSNTFLFSCLNEALNSVKKNVVLDNVICKTPICEGLTFGVEYKVLAKIDDDMYVIEDDDEYPLLVGKSLFK